MLNNVISIKIKQRLNKLDSQDYDNLECWQIVESFNKAQVEWARRQLHGINLVKEGDEGSTRRKDDLQILMETFALDIANKDYYYDGLIPDDYLQWKRVDIFANKDCCEKRPMMVYLAEEANLRELLRDKSKQPNFEWGETFATQPIKIQILNCVDPYTNVISTQEVQCEFKDDIIELLIDEAASILAGDIESVNQFSRGTEGAERNN